MPLIKQSPLSKQTRVSSHTVEHTHTYKFRPLHVTIKSKRCVSCGRHSGIFFAPASPIHKMHHPPFLLECFNVSIQANFAQSVADRTSKRGKRSHRQLWESLSRCGIFSRSLLRLRNYQANTRRFHLDLARCSLHQ